MIPFTVMFFAGSRPCEAYSHGDQATLEDPPPRPATTVSSLLELTGGTLITRINRETTDDD
jgi:hypothetical protein